MSRAPRLFLAGAVVGTILAASFSPASANRARAASALSVYLALMADQSYDSVVPLLDESGPGSDPRPGLSPAVDNPTARVWAATLSRQHDMVVTEFGPQAWRSATFRLERVASGETRDIWVDCSGREITQEEASARLDSFWAEVAVKEAVDLSVIFSPPGSGRLSEAERLSFEEKRRRAAEVFHRYAGREPVKVRSIQLHPAFLAHLAFAPERELTQDHHFTLYLVGYHGAWRIWGFDWHGPDCLMPTDI